MTITNYEYKQIINGINGLQTENGDAKKLYTTEFEQAHKNQSNMFFSEFGWLNAMVDKNGTIYFEFNTTEYKGTLEFVPCDDTIKVFVNENWTENNESVIKQTEWLINTFGNTEWKFDGKEETMKNYSYGMKERGFSIGCQPKQGFVERMDDNSGEYYDIIVYDRPLTDEEIAKYELADLNEEETEQAPVEPTIKPMIQTLENLFDVFNKRFFDGKLETPVITIAPDTCRAYGWFTTWRAWKETANKDSDGYYEITVTADYLDRDPVDIAATLLHEMIHLYNRMNGVNDCSRSGKYHNKHFKAAAESHGLICEKSRTYGFSQTAPTDETAEFIKTLDLHFELYRPMTSEKPTPDDDKGTDDKSDVDKKTKKRSSTRKYVCPVCGTIIRATKEVNVICGECGVPFELVED